MGLTESSSAILYGISVGELDPRSVVLTEEFQEACESLLAIVIPPNAPRSSADGVAFAEGYDNVFLDRLVSYISDFVNVTVTNTVPGAQLTVTNTTLEDPLAEAIVSTFYTFDDISTMKTSTAINLSTQASAASMLVFASLLALFISIFARGKRRQWWVAAVLAFWCTIAIQIGRVDNVALDKELGVQGRRVVIDGGDSAFERHLARVTALSQLLIPIAGVSVAFMKQLPFAESVLQLSAALSRLLSTDSIGGGFSLRPQGEWAMRLASAAPALVQASRLQGALIPTDPAQMARDVSALPNAIALLTLAEEIMPGSGGKWMGTMAGTVGASGISAAIGAYWGGGWAATSAATTTAVFVNLIGKTDAPVLAFMNGVLAIAARAGVGDTNALVFDIAYSAGIVLGVRVVARVLTGKSLEDRQREKNTSEEVARNMRRTAVPLLKLIRDAIISIRSMSEKMLDPARHKELRSGGFSSVEADVDRLKKAFDASLFAGHRWELFDSEPLEALSFLSFKQKAALRKSIPADVKVIALVSGAFIRQRTEDDVRREEAEDGVTQRISRRLSKKREPTTEETNLLLQTENFITNNGDNKAEQQDIAARREQVVRFGRDLAAFGKFLKRDVASAL